MVAPIVVGVGLDLETGNRAVGKKPILLNANTAVDLAVHG